MAATAQVPLLARSLFLRAPMKRQHSEVVRNPFNARACAAAPLRAGALVGAGSRSEATDWPRPAGLCMHKSAVPGAMPHRPRPPSLPAHMATLGSQPRAFRVRGVCDVTTPWAPWSQSAKLSASALKHAALMHVMRVSAMLLSCRLDGKMFLRNPN